MSERKVVYEICPVCKQGISPRHALVHYRAHARRGELIGGCLVGDKHTRFRLPGTPDVVASWWRHGQRIEATLYGEV
jgi:hypothetical protein